MARWSIDLFDESSLADESVFEQGKQLVLAEKGYENDCGEEKFRFIDMMNPDGDLGKKNFHPH